MKQNELKAIRERFNQSTQGEWEPEYGSDGKRVYLHFPCGSSVNTKDGDEVVVGGVQDEQGGAIGILSNADTDFIVHAHSDIPALLDHIQLLNKRIRKLNKKIREQKAAAVRRWLR